MLDQTQEKRLDWILSCAVDAEDKLSEWENGFIRELVERREKQGFMLTVSEKMWSILERIHEKVPL